MTLTERSWGSNPVGASKADPFDQVRLPIGVRLRKAVALAQAFAPEVLVGGVHDADAALVARGRLRLRPFHVSSRQRGEGQRSQPTNGSPFSQRRKQSSHISSEARRCSSSLGPILRRQKLMRCGSDTPLPLWDPRVDSVQCRVKSPKFVLNGLM